MAESGSALYVLSEVDTALVNLPEKLTGLENLLTLVLSRESDIKADDDVEMADTPADFVEKAFAFHLLYAILIFELRDLNGFITYLHDLVVETLRRRTLHDASSPPELPAEAASRLHDSADLLRRWQERVVVMNVRLAKLQMTSFLFGHDAADLQPELVSGERRLDLRMLETSLAREMELEKKVSELKRTEEVLRLKTHLTEQVSAAMEVAAEVAWGRFLESDNAAEVWMGISKDLLNKLQTPKKMDEKDDLLTENDDLIQRLNSITAQLASENAEVTGLKERVKMFEEKLGESESQLAEAVFSSTRSQLQLKEMGVEFESLRESLLSAEGRAASAEEKVAHLAELNLELSEELDFLKGSSDSLVKKAGMLEKQVTQFDVELEHARASSEASQEQQNMLYRAMFDMETLIDELKQKALEAEVKAESAEGRCKALSETNSELSKELNLLRSRMEFRFDKPIIPEKRNGAEDAIRITSTVIMDTVLQIATERERIHKKLVALAKENRLLREEMEATKSASSTFSQNKIDNAAASKVEEEENGKESSSSSSSSDFASEIATSGISDGTESSLDANIRRYMLIIIAVLLLSALLAAHYF